MRELEMEGTNSQEIDLEDFSGEKVFKMRKGTNNKGTGYEKKMIALVAQRCTLNNDIKDFCIWSNPPNFAAFDDIVLHVHYKNGSKKLYLIQLKHKDNDISKNKFDNIRNCKDDFSLKKYEIDLETIKANKINGHIKNIDLTEIIYILYTNVDVTGIEGGILNNIKVASSKTDDHNEKLLRTSLKDDKIFQFENKEGCSVYDEEFLKKFYLYTKQASRGHIEGIMKNEILDDTDVDVRVVETFARYIESRFSTSRNTFSSINKLQTAQCLVRIILTQYLSEPECTALDLNSRIYENLITSMMEFNILFVRQGDTPLIWVSILHKLRQQYKEEENQIAWSNWNKTIYKNYTMKDAYIDLFLKSELPLLVKYENMSISVINKVLKLFEQVVSTTSVALINSSTNFPQNPNENLKIFENLVQLNNKNKLDFINISLKNNDPVLLSSLTSSANVLEKINPSVYIQLLKKHLKLIDRPNFDMEYYINRTLKVTVLNKDLLFNKKELFILNSFDKSIADTMGLNSVDFEDYYGKFKKFKKDTINNIDKNMKIDFEYEHINILTKKNDVSMENVIKLWNLLVKSDGIAPITKNNIHILQYCQNSEGFQMIYTTGTQKDFSKHLKIFHVKEEELLNFSKSSANIVSSNAGMGKTTLLDSLMCRVNPNEWPTRINLVEFIEYVNDTRHLEESNFIRNFVRKIIPPYISEEFCYELYTEMIKKGLVTWFIDGFFEDHSNNVLDFLQKAHSKGIKLWITTRPSVVDELKKIFRVYSMDMDHFTETDRYRFLKRYCSTLDDDKVKKYSEIIRKSSLDEKLIGTPLQIRMFVDVLQSDETSMEKLNIAQLYTKFISHKLDEWWQLTAAKLAMTLFFSKNLLQTVVTSRDLEASIKSFKQQKNFIITGFTKKNEPIYNHRTYAEFLVADLLATESLENESYRHIVTKLFYKEMNSSKLFFDMIAANDKPLHLAVLQNNLKEVKRLVQEHVNDKDMFERTALHLACSYGKFYDMYRSEDITGLKNVEKHNCIKRVDENNITLVSPEVQDGRVNLEIVKILMEHSVLDDDTIENEKDFLGFGLLDYGLKSCSLENLNELCYCTSKILDIGIDLSHLLLFHSVTNGFNSILDKYLSKSVNVQQVSKDLINGETLLHMAVKAQNTQALKILKNNLEIDIKNNSGLTPLHVAAQLGYESVATTLIELGANINLKCENGGYTPLMYASISGHHDFVKSLLHHKADTELANNIGRTAFICACENGHAEVVNLFLPTDIDINSFEGINTAFIWGCKNGHKAVVDLLIKKGVDVNVCNKFGGKTAFMYACENGNTEIVQLLLKNNVDKDYRNKDGGKTALIYTCERGRLDVVKLLIKHKVDMELAQKQNKTGLMYACKNGHEEVARLLIENGANIYASEIYGKTPFDYASENGKLNPYKLFPNYDNKTTLNCHKIKEPKKDVKTIMLNACMEGDLPRVEQLINKGVNINDIKYEHNKTAFMFACERGRIKVVQYLIDLISDINVGNSDDKTALIFASKYGHTNVVQLLLDKRKNISLDSKDKYGKSALMYAYENGDIETVNLLLKNGANDETIFL